MRYCLIAIIAYHLTSSCCAQDQIRFRRHLINAESEFSAATAIDMNQDGRLDIVSGAWWYESPNWNRHKFRDVQQIRGRFDDYSNLPLDVDGDGDTDIISVNYRSESLYWCRNPWISTQGRSSSPELWSQIVIDEPGASETGRLVDINGDGRLDVLPNGTKFAAWYEPIIGAASNEVQWLRHDLPPELAGHGIGAGDINGDGLVDLVNAKGWAEAPTDAEQGRWIWHPEFELARDCGLPILCVDVDQDGDTDLVWGRGHNVGLYWTEQLSPQQRTVEISADVSMPPATRAEVIGAISRSKWRTHAIDTRWSCAHSLMLADIDGDGMDDLVTGRRFMGHDGKDPGENDPLSIHWYRFESKSKTWHEQIVTAGGTCGIDLDFTCADLDDDGDLDIIAPARSGLHWIENLRIAPDVQQAEPLVITSPSYDDHQDLSHYLSEDLQRRPISNALEHGIRRSHVLVQLQQAMGQLPNSAQRVALEIHIASVVDAQHYWRIELTYAAEPGDRVPAFLLLPKNLTKPAKAMLCLHPTHFSLGKAQICGLGGKPSRFYAHELAERGFVCLAPDYPSFADYDYDFAKDKYLSGSMKAIWNNIRAIDLLESLPCVSRDEIGAIGHSLGGHNALFSAAFDQRIRCVVTSCGFTAFEDYYGGDLKGWTSERYMPSIARVYRSDPRQVPFDFPEVLAAIFPRPVFVNAPSRDSNFAVEGVKKCEASLKPLFHAIQPDSPWSFHYPDAEHDFPMEVRQEAYDWLGQALD